MISMFKAMLKITTMPVYGRYVSIMKRVRDLEIAIDTLILRPEWQYDLKHIFNGQIKRVKIYNEIIDKFNICEIIETGTLFGDTTGYFAQTLPNVVVRTCEVSPRFSGLAQMRLRKFHNVRISCSDSRAFLSELSELDDDLAFKQSMFRSASFVYLDAHWEKDLPLREELNIIKHKRKSVIIMIDDFKVPGDSGYSFDKYGANKELSIECFGDEFKKNGFVPYFPVAYSQEDTGYRRGCVVLVSNDSLNDTMNSMNTLKRFKS